jgi:hypothetical protein
MKLPVSDQALDSAKKTIGTLLIAAAAFAEIFVEPGSQLGRAGSIAGMIGGILLGLGLMNARGKSAAALLQQVFGTSNVNDVAADQVAQAARGASLPPRPGPNPPPPPRSQP